MNSERHAVRAKWHDYNGGIYFVTICSHKKAQIFGRINNNRFYPTHIGNIVKSCIEALPNHHSCEVLNYVIMPNHVHIVINVMAVGAQYIAPTSTTPTSNYGCLRPPKYGVPVDDNHFNSRLAVIIRTFKAAVTRIIRNNGINTSRAQSTANSPTPGAQCIAPLQGFNDGPVWQRNYHEHIIRNQQAYNNIMNYIDTNVENWNSDCFAK